MNPSELERRASHAFSRLPTPAAPSSLLPRVMEALPRQASRRWYLRHWLTWPPGWQAGSIAASLALIGAIFYGLPIVEAALSHVVAGLVGGAGETTLGHVSILRVLAETAATVSSAFVSGWTPVLLPLYLVMLAASVVLGATIYRVTSMQGIQL